uniref:Uncharacterized protein n=1 Tax=Avena sativa TaxID=4498 RepID=A0ACD5T6Q7_AVESA
MLNPREIVASLFMMLNKEAYILIRIEFLVVAISGLFLAMFIMDYRRNRSHAAVRKSILKVLDSVSDNMVVYTLGAMQAALFRNQLFPVWAMVVVSFRSSIDYISGSEPRGLEAGNLMKPLGLAFLNTRRGSVLKVHLWTLWAVMVLRSLYRALARAMANNSWWNGNSVKFVTEYMRGDHEDTNLKPDVCNTSTMEGYTYLIYGESRQRVRVQRPRYILYLRIVRPRHLVTLDKIWQCTGRLLRSGDSRGEHVKDMCLAFALSGLLRCRLEDAALHDDSLFLTRNLVRSKILMKNAKRAFGILELELTFLNDALHTRYPVIFWGGLSSLALSLAVSLLTLGVACWLAVEIRKVIKPPEGDLMHVVSGANVDIVITWVLMLFMIFKEVWEMVTYLLSDWTRLLLVCKYVQWRCSCMRNSLTEKLIWSFFTSNIGGRWHGFIDQYEFLRSFDHIPSNWNRMHRMTLGLIPRKSNGQALGTAIKVPECIKPAIMRTLRCTINRAEGGRLPGHITSLNNAGAGGEGDLLDSRFGWACRLSTCSQVILVWHIATSLCEINLALDLHVDLTEPEFLRSPLSWLKGFFSSCCCSSKPPFLVDESSILNDDDIIKTNYLIANSLSRYCAYLLFSQPEMLPDSFLMPDLIFNATVEDACQVLNQADSLHSRYTRLTTDASSLTVQDKDEIKSTGNLLKQGMVLGWDLIQLDSAELRWKILAGVWVDLIVHIAPTWNIKAHTRRLESGGEFLTHIWALLCHFGIEKSSLWPGQ